MERSYGDRTSIQQLVTFQLQASNIQTKFSHVNFELSRKNDIPSGSYWQIVYRSPVFMLVDESVSWENSEISVESLCNNDLVSGQVH